MELSRILVARAPFDQYLESSWGKYGELLRNLLISGLINWTNYASLKHP
jgi:hypothetical protein